MKRLLLVVALLGITFSTYAQKKEMAQHLTPILKLLPLKP